ncbi:MAG: aminotransferase class IV [Geminicoccaceae bacterium]
MGDGVFDTSLVLNGVVAFADRHWDRLAASCAAFGIPFDRDAVVATLDMAAAEVGTGALRVTVTRGAGPRGLLPPACPEPRIIVSAHPAMPARIWQPLRLALTEIRRNETSPTSRHKCLAYADAILALHEAIDRGANEVLFRNMAGHVACCATGNLFILDAGILKTPPLADGVLAGVLRQAILELAPAASLKPLEERLTVSDLKTADAVFMTNSLHLIAPVTALDTAPLTMRGLGHVARLAHALVAHIQERHRPCPWIEEGTAAWPISA